MRIGHVVRLPFPLFVRVQMFALLAILAVAGPLLAGCETLRAANPVAVAETPEQRAYAVYGSFVVFEEAMVPWMEDRNVSDATKRKLADLDAQAKPLADRLLTALVDVQEIRRALQGMPERDERLRLASINLERWIAELQPHVDGIKAIIAQ